MLVAEVHHVRGSLEHPVGPCDVPCEEKQHDGSEQVSDRLSQCFGITFHDTKRAQSDDAIYDVGSAVDRDIDRDVGFQGAGARVENPQDEAEERKGHKAHGNWTTNAR